MSKNVIRDGLAVTINFKWLLQLLVIVATITYAFYTFQLKLNDMEGQIADNMIELQELIEIHEKASEIQIMQMQETIKWYQTQLNLNPFSWGKQKQ